MVAPSLVLTNGRILTQDDESPVVEAISFAHGRVLETGQAKTLRKRAGPRTEVRDLEEKVVLPGFVDCHTHVASLGGRYYFADLSDADSKDQALKRLENHDVRLGEAGWILGWNWDETKWAERTPLRSEDLDDISRTRPVMALRACGHAVVANGEALDLLDPPPSSIPEDDGGDSGTFTEDAGRYVWSQVQPSHRQAMEGLRAESRRLARLGITSIADTAGSTAVKRLTTATAAGRFLQRAGLYLRADLLEALESISLGPIRGARCSLLGVKAYADGSLGARTAALRESFEDRASRGTLRRSPSDIRDLASRASALGLQMKTHAVGDRAIDAVLEGYEGAGILPGDRARIEHAELLHEEHLKRMEERGIIAAMQPNFVARWQYEGGIYDQTLGEKRAEQANPFRSVLDAGVPLAFSSDGMPYGPLYGIHAAVNHRVPKERLSPEEAIRAYTRGAAYAIGCEDTRGILRPGAVGDAVVLSDDPRTTQDIKDIDVVFTVFDGEVVSEYPASPEGEGP